MSKEINSKLHEYSVSGNIEGVKKCINDGFTNIYSRTIKRETPLYFAMKNGQTEVATLLWNIYENDLKFIERSVECNDKFWMSGPILIGFGNENIASLEKLYSQYQNCECDCAYAIDKTKCVVFLLKSDNFMCKKVLCVSPTTVNGRKFTLDMTKCAISNGFLDLNSIIRNKSSLLQAAVKSGLINLFEKLLQFGAKLDETQIICSAIEFGHIDILEKLNKRSPFRMYNILVSCNYNSAIYENDNWQMFKYVIERCIDETHLTFSELINLPVSYNLSTDLTVFQIAVVRNCYKIGENCLPYGPKPNKISQGTSFGDCLLQFSNILRIQEAHNLVVQLVELDPSLLKYVYNAYEEYCNGPSLGSFPEYDPIGFLHEFVLRATNETIQTIYVNYPFVGQLFFIDIDIGIYYLCDMLEKKLDDKIMLVLANCGVEQPNMESKFRSIVYEIARSKHDNIELLLYAISLRDCHLSNLPLDGLLVAVVEKGNIRILNWILAQVNYDLHHRLAIPFFDHLGWTLYDLIYWMFYVLNNGMNSYRTTFDKLLKIGCGYTATQFDGKNLLHYAVQQNNFYATKKLLELGIDFNLSDNLNKLPIHYATSVEILDLLNTWTPTSKLNIHTRSERNSILHLIVSAEFPADRCGFIKYVLDNGGNLNAVNSEGRSALFYVRDLETTKLFLTYKPNLDLLDKNGETALIYLMSGDNHDDHRIIDTLYQKDVLDRKNSIFWLHLERKCNNCTSFLVQTIRNCRQCTRTLMKIPNINVCVRDCYNSTPLHEAAKLIDVDLCQQFIEKGLTIDLWGHCKKTALLEYCRNFVNNDNISYDGFMQFLKFNPDINIKCHYEISAIMIIARSEPDFDCGNIICELLSRGADLMDTGYNNKTVYSSLSPELQRILKFLT